MTYLNFDCHIEIKENILDLNIEDFLEIAVRNNEKRRFLFVSKVLGKHIACRAKDMDNLGKLIVEAYNKKRNPTKGVVISFAETGTAIGHSVFNYMENDYEFLHTTREVVEGFENLDFLEEHSHATNHNLYFNKIKNFQEGEEVILVDDEVTTANTCINLIKKIHELYPQKKYTICSILNWVEDMHMERTKELEKSLGCSIEFVYLFKGQFQFKLNDLNFSNNETKENKFIEDKNENLQINYIKLDMDDYVGEKRYIKYTGRFGIDKINQKKLKYIVKRESKKINIEDKNAPVLFLGTEEFMYIPMLFAKYCNGNIYYHSTTRSPIINIDKNDYPIKSKFEFNSLYNKNVKNYLYNIDKKDYNECFLFVEFSEDKKVFEEIINIFKQTSIKKLNIVSC